MQGSNNSSSSCVVPIYLEKFSLAYSDVHKYLALVLCCIGSATNVLNIAVLCQKSMRNPTNTLLTALAVSDCIMSTVYLPFCLYFTMGNRIKRECPEPYPWALFLMLQVCTSILAHAVSLWVTVALAVFRLIYIKLPVRSKQLCTNLTSRLTVAAAVVASSFMLVPNILGHEIMPAGDEKLEKTGATCSLRLNASYYEYTMGSNSIISDINFWVMAVFIKCLPVLLLTVLSILLIKSLKRTVRRRRTLRASSRRGEGTGGASGCGAVAAAAALAREVAVRSDGGGGGGSGVGGGGGGGGGSGDDVQSNRTTKLLITIVLVSVFSILPQGAMYLVLTLLKSEDKNCFTKKFYDPFGDLFDLMTLFNHSINFIFYYGMSKQFRGAFSRLLRAPGGYLGRENQRHGGGADGARMGAGGAAWKLGSRSVVGSSVRSTTTRTWSIRNGGGGGGAAGYVVGGGAGGGVAVAEVEVNALEPLIEDSAV